MVRPVPPLARCAILAGSALLTGSVLLTAGCGVPPELRAADTTVTPAPTDVSPTPTTTPVPPSTPASTTAAPTPSGFPEAYVSDCAGRPSGGEVIAVLRGPGGPLRSGLTATVASGPSCAGTWQYTVVDVPGREPLGVVTRGTPGALEMVTAGTDVCTARVRVEAPPGIRTAAACAA